jgi:ADP-ribose pyrophosphatase YjhB (NUDIX family)
MDSFRLKRSVALVVRDTLGGHLVVKRPDDPGDDLASVWGFPAVSSRGNETEIEMALRAARTKLGITVAVGRRIGEAARDLGPGRHIMVDYEAKVLTGIPEVPQEDGSVTQYVDWKFTNDPETLLEAAIRGSQCAQVFLDDVGIDWRDKAGSR